MNPTLNDHLDIRSIPDAGRGVIATGAIAKGTSLHCCLRPVAHVIFRKYRKEVCAQCFHYNRGRALPERSPEYGKVFCGTGCRQDWLDDQGPTGLSAWQSFHEYTTKHAKSLVDSAQHEPKGPLPERESIDVAWLTALESVKLTRKKSVAANTERAKSRTTISKHKASAYPSLIDPDLIGFLLSALLSEQRDGQDWFEQVRGLAMDETPYKSQYDLQAHCASFAQLFVFLPVDLAWERSMEICRLAIHAGSHNAFGIRAGGEDSEEYMGYGVYPSASYFNHSCEPNVAKLRIGQAWQFSAARDIRQDEQCCITYLGGDEKDLSVVDRRERLSQHWSFTCMCTRCIIEGASIARPADLAP